MKRIFGTLSIALGFMVASCGNNVNTTTPSINENSVNKKAKVQVDYSNIESSKLLKHIQAHYDLGEYETGKDKLNYLMTVYKDTLDGVDLIDLKGRIDSALEEEQQKKAALAEAELKKRMPSAVNKMRKIEDGKTTFFYDKSSPEFDSKECFYAYIKKDIYGARLFFKARYVGTDWIDFQNCMVTVDKLDYTIEGTVQKSETKGKKAYKHELMDVEVTTPDQMKALKAIANGSAVTALLIGSETYKKRELSQDQINAFRNVIDAYIFMGGEKLEPMKTSVTNTQN